MDSNIIPFLGPTTSEEKRPGCTGLQVAGGAFEYHPLLGTNDLGLIKRPGCTGLEDAGGAFEYHPLLGTNDLGLKKKDLVFQVFRLRGVDSNHRPPGYEPDELPLLYPASAFREPVLYTTQGEASRT